MTTGPRKGGASPPGDGGYRSAMLAAGAVATAMIAQQVAGKAARDALFLSHYPAQELPKAMIGSAMLSLVAAVVVSRAIARIGPARLVPVVFVANGLLFAAEWHYVAAAPEKVAWLVYLHVGALGATVSSGFWSVVNERFDPHLAKKAIARIGIAATFGGLLGGLGAERVAELLDLRAMLVILAVVNGACALGLLGIGKIPHVPLQEQSGTASGLRVLRETPYVRHLGLLVALMAITEALLDYGLKAQAAEELVQETQLLRFFAVFHAGTSLLTFLLQTLLARKALNKLGVDGTVALLPAASLLCAVLGAALPRLWTTVLARGAVTVLDNSLFRSGYEVLFTPLTADKKRPTKIIIDVAFERIGDALGSGLVLGALALVSGSGIRVVLAVAALTAGMALWISQRLHRGYVDALADSLRSGAVELEDEEDLDATTLQTLTLTSMGMKREQLLEQLEAMRAARPSVPPDSAEHAEELVEAVRDLESGEAERIRRALSQDEGPDPRLVPFIVPLLRRDDLRNEVVHTLRALCSKVPGQLVDALLDPDQPFVIRRRMPEVLQECRSKRAIRGLFEGLADERFEVRYRCGYALSHLTVQGVELGLPRNEVLEAVRRELDVSQTVWQSQAMLEERRPEASWLDEAVRKRLHRRLEHVFTVLSLVLPREPLELSLRALYGDDPAMRGTALEYLESILPESIRGPLWPYLSGERRRKATPRPQKAIVEDLLQSAEQLAGVKRRQGGGSDPS